MLNNPHRYDHIMHLPNPEPTVRPRMAIEKRAAQFAPFAALTGYEESVAEEARLTEEKLELSEDMIDMLTSPKPFLLLKRIKSSYEVLTEFLLIFPSNDAESGGIIVSQL